MATSTNYGWSEPDNTSLVKDGAQAIRTLGDAIDTSLWNSGYGQAGKNKIINGDFGIWQRGISFSVPGNSGAYTADRWAFNYNAAMTTHTVTRQTFTPGTAPVAGYEGTYYLRSVITTPASATVCILNTKLEDVRQYAGQTVTFSFWAKNDGSRTLGADVSQNFGSGGSASVTTTFTLTNATVGTAWTRVYGTITIPSITGKTVGTSSYLAVNIYLPVAAGATTEIWGVQVEYGSKATPFQTASGGSIQGELAMCQRYLPSVATGTYIMGGSSSTTNSYFSPTFQVPARVTPTGITISALSNYAVLNAAVTSGTPTAIAFGAGSTSNALLQVTTTVGTPTIVSGQTAYLFLTSGNILFTGCEL
jgi:hypothetical protein